MTFYMKTTCLSQQIKQQHRRIAREGTVQALTVDLMTCTKAIL